MKIIIKIVLPLIIIGSSALYAKHIYNTRPKAKKKKIEKTARMVSSLVAKKSTEQIVISANGTVMPAQKILLQSRVNGEIVKINSAFRPGAHLKKNDVILELDKDDLKLAEKKAQTTILQLKTELKLEEGRQLIAKTEWEMMGVADSATELEKKLALRTPQLEKIQTQIKAAEIELELVRLNLSRTTITAPFNCIVLSKKVDLGAQITTQSMLGELIGTDEYWIKISLSQKELGMIDTSTKSVVLIKTDFSEWKGKVIEILPDVTTNGRMTSVLLSVKNPAKKDEHSLLIGDYVKVNIPGKQVKNIMKISRDYLRDDNKVWIFQEGYLHIQTIEISYKDRDFVYITQGIQSGDKIIISPISTPVENMQLKLLQTP
ncbi:MAG: efflux RND transporter periplasmic adaptor subunit [Verrucomicrobiota bacterium]|nr:efflux RND transporter periplasmic adaptor subunit [Verrucomicrobiota bacterium]